MSSRGLLAAAAYKWHQPRRLPPPRPGERQPLPPLQRRPRATVAADLAPRPLQRLQLWPVPAPAPLQQAKLRPQAAVGHRRCWSTRPRPHDLCLCRWRCSNYCSGRCCCCRWRCRLCVPGRHGTRWGCDVPLGGCCGWAPTPALTTIRHPLLQPPLSPSSAPASAPPCWLASLAGCCPSSS